MTARLAATMREAMRLLKTGNLGAATSAIKTGLQPAPHVHTAPPFDDAIEGSYRTFHDAPAPAFVPPKRETPWTPPRDTAPDRFITGSFSSDHGTRQYKLFVPGGHQGEPLPLVVMLHGCTQSADDFARGTRMNVLAAARPCFVLYPEQAQSANGSKCWNWFRSSDQMRNSGEPAIIAGLTREIVTTYDLDARRVYIAGLSAGGAMAVVMGELYPDVYAAIGVHSGLPFAAAHDAASAFAAMKGKHTQTVSSTHASGPLIPTIVVHGDRDKTVHPDNGHKVAFAAHDKRNGAHPRSDKGRVPRGHTYTRTELRDEAGKVIVEYWLVHGGGHAWFGGNSEGSHTDPRGPDASHEMLRFFYEHKLNAS